MDPRAPPLYALFAGWTTLTLVCPACGPQPIVCRIDDDEARQNDVCPTCDRATGARCTESGRMDP